RLYRRRPHPPLAAPRGMLPRRVRRGPANAQSIRPGHQAPDRRRLRGLHPGEPAGHRPRSGAAPRHLRHARLPATAPRGGGSGRTMNDIAARRLLPALTFALSIDRVLNGLTRPFFGWVSDLFFVLKPMRQRIMNETQLGRTAIRPTA